MFHLHSSRGIACRLRSRIGTSRQPGREWRGYASLPGGGYLPVGRTRPWPSTQVYTASDIEMPGLSSFRYGRDTVQQLGVAFF